MNSNTSEESHIISVNQSSTPLNTIITENHPSHASQSEHTIQSPTQLPIIQTGENEFLPISPNSEIASFPTNEINSIVNSSNLQSLVSPHQIRNVGPPPNPRIVSVREEDVDMLCQIIKDVQEQCNYEL